MFSYISAEQRVPQNHPLRPLRKMVDEALMELSPRFAKMYAKRGRPSIAPEKLLRALLLQVLYTIRSERQLMEQLDYNLLYRWFVGLNMDDAMWDVTVFTKNRERLLKGNIAQAFFRSCQSFRLRIRLHDPQISPHPGRPTPIAKSLTRRHIPRGAAPSPPWSGVRRKRLKREMEERKLPGTGVLAGRHEKGPPPELEERP